MLFLYLRGGGGGRGHLKQMLSRQRSMVKAGDISIIGNILTDA